MEDYKAGRNNYNKQKERSNYNKKEFAKKLGNDFSGTDRQFKKLERNYSQVQHIYNVFHKDLGSERLPSKVYDIVKDKKSKKEKHVESIKYVGIERKGKDLKEDFDFEVKEDNKKIRNKSN